MPPERGEGPRRAAAERGISVSAWLSEAAADRLRNELLDAHAAFLVAPADPGLTSNPDDIRALLRARGIRARVQAA